MKKTFAASLVALVALGASVASAQSYYFPAPSYTYGSASQPYSGACVNLASDLSYGSRGSQVSPLQTFLVSQNFPGGGSWMITGYFGNATLAAVRNFQQQQGLSVSGVVDAATRSAISRVSCLGQSGPSLYNYNYSRVVISSPSPTYSCGYSQQTPYSLYGGYIFGLPNQNPYGYGSSYSNYYCPPSGAPSISSVSGPTSLAVGVQGTWTITVNNPSNSYMTTSVNWGDTAVWNTSAAPQTTYQQGTNTLTFTHTYYTAGTYTVVFTVGNTSGQTNTSSATVNVGSGSYGNVTLSSISPTSGYVGTQIVLRGNGFNQLDNTVRFGIGGTQHVPSQNGTVIHYTIPAYVSPCDLVSPGGICAQYLQQVLPGPIQVHVMNSSGTSNMLLFQVQ